jgi:outer membrane receptor protein involved in Fe transport
LLAAAYALFSGFGAMPAVAQESATRSYQISSQALSTALKEFAARSDMQVIFSESDVRNLVAPELSGNHSPREALKILLKGTPLEFEFTANDVIVVRKPLSRITASPSSPADVSTKMAPSPAANPEAVNAAILEDIVVGIPEILVYGSMSLNADIQRTENDIQPYVVFGSEEIRRSAASTLEDFLRNRLPMNKQGHSESQVVTIGNTDVGGNTRSTFNLRGLGSNQTLILVDGRRMPSVSLGGGRTAQPDINGIPMSSIERIEVLPSSASGIYGGSATGGVINIIRKRNHSGLVATGGYSGTFAGGASRRQLDFSGSFVSREGRTSVSWAGGYSGSSPLLVGDRQFARKARALRGRNVPFNDLGDSVRFSVPLGATPNVVSRFDFDLDDYPDLVLDDGTPLGSPIAFVPAGYTFTPEGGDGGQALVANAGQFNLDLANDIQGLRRSLLNTSEVSSASATLRHEFSDRFASYLDLSLYRNESRGSASSIANTAFLLADAPNNPFQQDINVTFPVDPGLAGEYRSLSETLQGSIGSIVRLPREWTLSASFDWSRSRATDILSDVVLDPAGVASLQSGEPPGSPDTRPALNALQGSPIDFRPYLVADALNPFVHGPNDTMLRTGSLRVSGPLHELPGGPLNLSALVERRAETAEASFERTVSLDDQTEENPSGITYFYSPERKLDVASLYVELNGKLIGEQNRRRGVHELSFQVSGRSDRQTTTSVSQEAIIERTPEPTIPDGPLPYQENTTTSRDLTAGLQFAPSEDVTLRASFGTGFLPPDISQVGSYEFVIPQLGGFEQDPRRGGTEFIADHNEVTYITGGNANLRPERSRSWSFGVILTPRFVSGLRVSVDYTRITKTDEIRFPTGEILQLEDFLPGRVIRGPKLPGDPDEWAGPILQLDQSYLNFAATRAQAYDIQIDYTNDAGAYGTFHTYLVATAQTELTRRLVLDPAVPPINYVGDGQADGPVRWTGNVGLDWNASPSLTLGWNAQYTHSYCLAFGCQQVISQGAAEIPKQIYHDLTMSYAFGEPRETLQMLTNTTVNFSVQNLFNEEPAIIAEGLNYSRYGDPRLRRYSLTVRKSF